jgi:hypothetical protein
MRLIKSLASEEQTEYIGEMSNNYRFRVEYLKDKNHCGEPDISVKNLKTQMR